MKRPLLATLVLGALPALASDFFSLAGSGSPDTVVVPKLHIYKGLPYGIDIGAFVGGASDVDATLYGLDARWALLDDGVATPAVAIRLSGTRASDIGPVRTNSEAGGTGLSDGAFNNTRVFAGLDPNLAVLNSAFEAEKLGENTTLSAKAGWRFQNMRGQTPCLAPCLTPQEEEKR